MRLHLTQPALSRHLAALERRVGRSLFLRTGLRMVPTPTGDLLLRHGREVLERVDEAEAALRAADGAELRTIRVGTEYYTGYSLATGGVEPEAFAEVRLLLLAPPAESTGRRHLES